MNKAKEWFAVTQQTEEVLDRILGIDLTLAKIQSLSKPDWPTIKLTMNMGAADLRRASILSPGTIDPTDFDLYKYNGIRLVLLIQAGDIISGYQEKT